MRAEIKYDWNDSKLTIREMEIAREISQMFLFGSKVKQLKSKLKEINSAGLPSNRKNLLPNRKFYSTKSEKSE